MPTPWLRRNWHRLLTHHLALAPLGILLFNFLLDNLGANPLRRAMLRTGEVGLILLVTSFACTPIAVVTGWRQSIQLRRALGLYGFLYLSLHFLIYAWLENDFNLELLLRDLGERRAMSVGLVALTLLIPLAITSTKGWQRRLGMHWRTLHRLIYLALPLGILHFYWLDRDFKAEPLTYALIVVLLFVPRISSLRRLFSA